MASIKRREDGQWRARYRDDAGREHTRHFARKIDAQRWIDETTAAVVTGQYVDPKAGKTTVASTRRHGRRLRSPVRTRHETLTSRCASTSCQPSGIALWQAFGPATCKRSSRL